MLFEVGKAGNGYKNGAAMTGGVFEDVWEEIGMEAILQSGGEGKRGRREQDGTCGRNVGETALETTILFPSWRRNYGFAAIGPKSGN